MFLAFRLGTTLTAGLFILVSLALAACQQTQDATATPTATSEARVEPTATARTVPTVPPQSPTATAVPTNTPVPPTPTLVPVTPSAVAVPTVTPTPAPETSVSAQAEQLDRLVGASLVAGAEQFIGELTPESESFDSVCNGGGDYGSPFSELSIFNPDSDFGGLFGTHSPFNPDAASPPAIVLDGETVGYLTVSPVLDDAVDPVSMLTHIGCEPPS